MVEVLPFGFKVGMLRQANTQKKIARGRAANSAFAASGNAEALAFADAWRDAHLEGIGRSHLAAAAADIANMLGAHSSSATMLARHSALERNGSNRSMD